MKKKVTAVLLMISMLLIMGNGYETDSVKRAEAAQATLGNENGFLLADKERAATVYVDAAAEEVSTDGEHNYCGLKMIAGTFADDVASVAGKGCNVVTDTKDMSGNVIIAGTIGHNKVIDALIENGAIDSSGLYKDGKLKWDCYQMQFVSGEALAGAGYSGVSKALVITGSNKRGAMYGLFHISERIGVSAWVYMADAVPHTYGGVYLDETLLEFNKPDMYLAKEPSVKYRGFFINDESPSFTGWAYGKFGGFNEKCYKNVLELLIRMKANYLWPAMWGNSFSDEGKEFKLANVVLADAYGVCMGTSHHEACCRAGIEWQKKYKNYGTSNEWNYDNNSEAIYKFWEDGIKRNGNYESTITLGMRGEADSALGGSVQQNVDRLKRIITDQRKIMDDYIAENPVSKAKDAPKVYIPYSENEEFFYGTDDGKIKGLNVWEGMDDVTVILTDDNYGNLRSIPEEKMRNRKAGWGLYYHLDGHVGTGAYEWVSSTQLEHIWDQLTMAYDYNIRDIWVVNVGDIKPLEMELNYAMALAYDMEKWGGENTAEEYRKTWLQNQLGGSANCSDKAAEEAADCVANFLKISTYRKPEYVKSSLYSNENYNEAQRVLALCEETIKQANDCYNRYFKRTNWDDAYYQLVYYQAVATANVTEMQIFKSLYDLYGKQKSSLANVYAGLIDKCVAYDKELTNYYNKTMSGGKWKKMMSSPHVGFTSWNSDGWSYPKASPVTLENGKKMLVSPDGDKNAYQTGSAALPAFADTVRERHCVTMGNGGTEEYSYTVESPEDWIQITDKNGDRKISGGTVKEAAYFYVSVDWDKVKENKTGTVVIKGNSQEVRLTVSAVCTSFQGNGPKTHVESNDVVTIDANEYINNVSAEDVTWKEIKGYGRYKSAMKMLPSTVSFTKPTGKTYTVKVGNNTRTVTEYEENPDAPYLEYQFYVDEDDDYIFTLYTTTTNNIFKPSDWGYVPVELFYGIAVDSGRIQNINSLPDGKYISYAADGDNKWKNGIMDNIHISTSSETLKKGVHTVRIYGMHAGLGVERLVISNKKIKSSYLGPDKTYYIADSNSTPKQKTGLHYEAFAPDGENPVPTPTPPVSPQPNAPNAGNNGNGGNNVVTPPSTVKEDNTVSAKNKIVKGKTYTYKKNKYKVTKLTKKGGNVKYMSPVKKSVKKIKIPAKIKLKGKTFKVTAIYKKAFKKCKKLKKITTSKALGKKYKKLIRKSIR